jgi:hypothetical protein
VTRFLLIVCVAAFGLAGCSGEDGVSGSADFETYSEGGNVWIVSDCPNTDQILSGNPDGLPYAGEIQTREQIEAWLGTDDNTRVIPRNGEAWGRNADGSVYTEQVEDFMIEVTLDDLADCPEAPVVRNGVEVVYRISD